MQHRDDIQIMRGMAVLLVVFFHLGVPFFKRGFLGVDAFFVISGFLMAILYKPGHVLDFYKRRASRLLPAYYVTVIATLIVSAVVVLPSEHTQVIRQGIFSAAFSSNTGFWLQNSYFSKADFNPLLHLWSLGVEIQFYLLVPLLAWLHMKDKRLILILGFGSLIAASVVASVSPKTAFFLTPFRIWQFLAGAVVAKYLTNDGALRFAAPSIGLISLLALLLVAMVYPVDGEAMNLVHGHPGLSAGLVTIVTAGVLAFGLPSAIVDSPLGLAFRKLGDWSYSIYLAHFPILVLVLYEPFSGTIVQSSNIKEIALIVLGIGALSALLYVLFDRRKAWPGGLTTVPALSGLVIALALLSEPMSRAGYSVRELNILSAFEDRSTYRCGKLNRIFHPGAQVCEITKGLPTGAPALMLVGDSHADSIKMVFSQAAQEHGYRVFFMVSNAPLLGSPTPASLLAEAETIGATGIVLHFSSGNAAAAYDSGFLKSAQEKGYKIVWLLPVPVYEESVPRAIWATRNGAPPIGLTPANFDEVSELAKNLHTDNIPTFDPWPTLCPKLCPLMDSDMHPFYFDNGHLTLTGARKLQKLFESAVDWFNGGKVDVERPA